MKRDTREDILKTAKELFNERGYNAVSVRDIADAVGISKGNLTYHFKKKEDIVEAILAGNPSGPLLDVPSNLKGLDDFFMNIERVVKENPFYFWHHAQMSQISEPIKEQQRAVYENNVKVLKDAFHELNKKGILRSEEFEGEYENLIDNILISGIYWMPFCQLKADDVSKYSFRDHAWRTIHHILYPTEKEEIIEHRIQ